MNSTPVQHVPTLRLTSLRYLCCIFKSIILRIYVSNLKISIYFNCLYIKHNILFYRRIQNYSRSTVCIGIAKNREYYSKKYYYLQFNNVLYAYLFIFSIHSHIVGA